MSEKEESPVASSDESSAEEIRQALQHELLEKGIDEQLTKLDPSATKHPSNWWQRVVGGIFLIALAGLVVWVILVGLGQFPPLFSGQMFTQQSRIGLVTTDGHQVVLLLRQSDGGEVRLLDLKTGEVTDISLGDKRASHASPSPEGDVVAYISTDENGSALYSVGITGGVTKIFDSSKLNDAASALSTNADTVATCEWTNLYWSPKAEKLAFFGCIGEASALFVVSVQADAAPTMVLGTNNSSGTVREAVWLDEDSIVFTSGNQPFDSVLLIDLTQEQPQRLYGPLN